MRTKEIDEKKALATLANNPIAKQDFLDRQSPTVAPSPHHQLSLLSVDSFLLYTTSYTTNQNVDDDISRWK